MGRGPAIHGRVMAWFNEHIGLTVHYADIAADLGVDKDSISKCCSNLVNRHPEIGVQRVGAGLYRYIPGRQEDKPKPTGKMFELIGTTRDGRLIIRDEDGVLWPLDPEAVI